MTVGTGGRPADAQLRFAKVNAIRSNTVDLTGINPPTGKHSTFTIDRPLVSRETLRTLKDAWYTKSFLKVYVYGKMQIEFEPEGAWKKRKDSYFSLVSYAGRCGYNPDFLKQLDEYLVTSQSYQSPIRDIGKNVLNLIDKLGNLYFARDQLVEINKSTQPDYVLAKYHIFTAITSCKASLDAMAIILNEVYGLGYTKGKIDMASTRSGLLNKLTSVNPKLGRQVKKSERWINDLTEYRDAILHRIMLLTPPVGAPKQVKCQVPSAAMTLGDPPSKKVSWKDANQFCSELIVNVEELIRLVCSNLLYLISSKTYLLY